MERPLPNPFARHGTQRAFNTIESEPEILRIHRLIEHGSEGQTADFKQIPYATSKRDDFLSDVCSFANTAGGLILLGVEENSDPPHTVRGIDENETQDVLKRLSDWSRKHLLPNANGVYFYKHVIHESTIIVISIQKYLSGPLYYNYHGGHVVKVRDGDGTRHARIDELSRLIKSSPSSTLQIQASLLADDFRRQSYRHNSIFAEMYGDTQMISDFSYPTKSSDWPDHVSKIWNTGMITDVQLVDVRGLDKSMYPSELEPMVNEDTIGSIGRIPGQSVACLLYEHKNGSAIHEFEETSKLASKLLRQTDLNILYQVPSLYGIRPETLNKWIHVLFFAAFQKGSCVTSMRNPGNNLKDLMPTTEELQSGSYYKRCRSALPGDIRNLSAKLLDEITAFA